MSDDKLHVIPQGRLTDTEIAIVLREEAREHIDLLCEVIDKAQAAGLKLNFQIVVDAFGRNRCYEISIVKPL